MNARLERLKVICGREDGRGKKVPVSRSHRNKPIDEFVCSVSIQFKLVEVLDLRKSCILRK